MCGRCSIRGRCSIGLGSRTSSPGIDRRRRPRRSRAGRDSTATLMRTTASNALYWTTVRSNDAAGIGAQHYRGPCSSTGSTTRSSTRGRSRDVPDGRLGMLHYLVTRGARSGRWIGCSGKPRAAWMSAPGRRRRRPIGDSGALGEGPGLDGARRARVVRAPHGSRRGTARR
jgi:hypothetical protein